MKEETVTIQPRMDWPKKFQMKDLDIVFNPFPP